MSARVPNPKSAYIREEERPRERLKPKYPGAAFVLFNYINPQLNAAYLGLGVYLCHNEHTISSIPFTCIGTTCSAGRRLLVVSLSLTLTSLTSPSSPHLSPLKPHFCVTRASKPFLYPRLPPLVFSPSSLHLTPHISIVYKTAAALSLPA